MEIARKQATVKELENKAEVMKATNDAEQSFKVQQAKQNKSDYLNMKTELKQKKKLLQIAINDEVDKVMRIVPEMFGEKFTPFATEWYNKNQQRNNLPNYKQDLDSL
jgi:hypothetical protein